MFIGKWNKSIIVTYLGVLASVLGIFLALKGLINYSLICLIAAGICDLFDGTFARMCKRTEEEKAFGIQLDSLADVANFIIFPIALAVGMRHTAFWQIIVYFVFAICGIQRLAHFNIQADTEEKVSYYTGMPVTYTALILPFVYLLSYALDKVIFSIIYTAVMLIIAILNIANFKNKKPSGIWYAVFSAAAIAMIVLYAAVLK